MSCERCGAGDVEIALSIAAGRQLCERCHRKTAPPISEVARRWRPPKPPPPTPSEWTRAVYGVWDRLEALSGHAPFYLGPDLGIAARCPACLIGATRVQFIGRGRLPDVVVHGCDLGCSRKAIFEQLI